MIGATLSGGHVFYFGWVTCRARRAEQLFAVRNPRSLGHKAVLPRVPFLDLLIRGALTGRLLLSRSARWQGWAHPLERDRR
ncbi:MAG: hypothetical protein DMG57_04500 [Acidobacteria bacterium]|nr:MAG: hypothetical protein DMG57_04500 [Acidobacteriota bacterium]